MNLNPRRLIVIGVVLLVVSAAVLYWGRAIIRDTIVVPISYLLWLVGVLLRNMHQQYFWIVALIIAFVIAYRSFLSNRKKREPVEMVPDIAAPSGRVEYWVARVNLMRMGMYYQSTFNEALGRLTLDLLAYRNRLTVRQVEQGLQSETLRVPEEVRNFLLTYVLSRNFERVPYFVYLYRSVRLWFFSRTKRRALRRDLLPEDTQCVIDYMEEELEVNYGNTGQ